jgi:hypothetical protein
MTTTKKGRTARTTTTTTEAPEAPALTRGTLKALGYRIGDTARLAVWSGTLVRSTTLPPHAACQDLLVGTRNGSTVLTFTAADGSAVGGYGVATKVWGVPASQVPAGMAAAIAAAVAETAATGAPAAVKASRTPGATREMERQAKRTAKAAAAATPAAPSRDGYAVRWPKGAVDLLQRQEGVDGPAWLVLCKTHNETTPATSGKAADALATRAARPAWCGGCAASAKAAGK